MNWSKLFDETSSAVSLAGSTRLRDTPDGNQECDRYLLINRPHDPPHSRPPTIEGGNHEPIDRQISSAECRCNGRLCSPLGKMAHLPLDECAINSVVLHEVVRRAVFNDWPACKTRMRSKCLRVDNRCAMAMTVRPCIRFANAL